MKQNVPILRGLTILVCSFFTLFVSTTRAQSLVFGPNSEVEVGLHLGPSNFLGDVGGHKGSGTTFLKDLNIPLTKMMIGAYGTVYPKDWLGVRLAANYGHVEGYDSIIVDKGGAERDRKIRGLGFRSVIFEAYAAVEIYPTVFFEQFEGLSKKFRPYGVLGIGLFHFNPKAPYNGPNGREWVPLKPLRLEGQGFKEYPDRKEYKLTQVHVPLGFGFKYYLSEKTFVGLEMLHRITFTDYIDDVSTMYVDPALYYNYMPVDQAIKAQALGYRESSNTGVTRPFIGQQRGDPKDNDSFLSMCLKLGIRLNADGNDRVRRQTRCPHYW